MLAKTIATALAAAALGSGMATPAAAHRLKDSTAAQIIGNTPGRAVTRHQAHMRIARYWRRSLALTASDRIRVSGCHVLARRGQKCLVRVHAPIVVDTAPVWVYFQSAIAPDGTVMTVGPLAF